MICGMCGRPLKGAASIEKGYGPICYRKINPPTARQKSSVEHYNLADDENYHVPGQMELSEFIDMPEVSEEKVND